MRFNVKAIFTRVTILVALFSIIVYILFTHVLPYAIIQPQRLIMDVNPKHVSAVYEKTEIKVDAIHTLRGYLFHPEQEVPKAIIILVHGIGGAKEHFFQLAGNLQQYGFSSLVMDNRAHGRSDGLYTTYGYFEKKDISKMVTYLQKKFPDIPIGIWGSSMGGAITLQSLAIDDRLSFGIVESTFTNLNQIVYDYQKRFSGGIGLRFTTDYTLNKAGKIAGFIPEDVNPLSAVKHIKQPVFIAHGDKDKRINYRYGEQLYEALVAKEKYFELVKGAGHLNLGVIGGKDYYDKVLLFIDKQLAR